VSEWDNYAEFEALSAQLQAAQAAIEQTRADALEEAAKVCEKSDRYRGEYFAGLIRALATYNASKDK